MAIIAGQQALASDFVSTSAGAGDSGKVPKLNGSGVLDTSFLPSSPSCRVYQNSGTSLTTTYAALAFQVESFDTDTMHDNSTNNSRITIKTAGKYMVTGNLNVATSGRQVGLQIVVNGTTVIAQGKGSPNSPAPSGTSVAALYEFAVNDYIELFGICFNSDSSSGDTATNFSAHKIG